MSKRAVKKSFSSNPAMLLTPAADPLQSAVVIAPQCNPLEHEWDYDFGMDALVTVCSWNTNGIMILAWMLW